jgi:hypothetical protein
VAAPRGHALPRRQAASVGGTDEHRGRRGPLDPAGRILGSRRRRARADRQHGAGRENRPHRPESRRRGETFRGKTGMRCVPPLADAP